MADENEKSPQEQEQEMHAQLTAHAVKLVDAAYGAISDALKPEMEAWLTKLEETVPGVNRYGTSDLQTNVEGAVLIAMLAVTNALLRQMPPARGLMYAASAHALSHRLVPATRAAAPGVPDTFPQSGTGKA